MPTESRRPDFDDSPDPLRDASAPLVETESRLLCDLLDSPEPRRWLGSRAVITVALSRRDQSLARSERNSEITVECDSPEDKDTTANYDCAHNCNVSFMKDSFKFFK